MSKLVTYYPDSATVKAAQNALQVQDAVNSQAVINSLQRDITAMKQNAEYICDGDVFNLDTDTINQHPVVILYLSKLCSLARYTGEGEFTRFSEAYAACQALSKEQHPEKFTIYPLH